MIKKIMLRKIMLRKMACTLIWVIMNLSTAFAVAEDLKVLQFGIISTESSQNLRQLWQPFLEDMQKALGVEVKAFFAADYAGIIQGMRFNKVDVAWLGNSAAIEAVDRANAEVFVQTMAVDGSPGYWSLLIVHKDSPYQTLEDVLKNRQNMTFGNGDPNSASGFLVPAYYALAQNGAKASDFKRTLNANHETNALAVANKQVDVATNNTEIMARLKDSHPEKLKEIRVVWQSPLIAGDPIVWRKNLSSHDKQKIKDFFLFYGQTNPQEKERLKTLAWAPFKASNDGQLLPMRQLRIFKRLSELEAETTLNDAEKMAEKIALETTLAELETQIKKSSLNE